MSTVTVHLTLSEVEQLRGRWPGGPPWESLDAADITFQNGDLVDIQTETPDTNGFHLGLVGLAEDHLAAIK